MTDCEKCPNWRPDKGTGGYNCQTRYCIDDPLADAKAASDEHWDEMQAEYDAQAEEDRQMAAAWDREREAFQDEMAAKEVW